MTTDPTYQKLLEASWRKPLTAAEEEELRAWLVTHPEDAAEWELEAGVDQALGHLKDLPVPSNFTARVMAAVERGQATEVPGQPVWGRIWRGLSEWLPRAAVAGVILGVGAIAYVHTNENARREQLVRSVETVCDVRSLPSPRILEDFDAIQELKPSAKPDVILLSLLE
jgi:anti-sigma factor RsiW